MVGLRGLQWRIRQPSLSFNKKEKICCKAREQTKSISLTHLESVASAVVILVSE